MWNQIYDPLDNKTFSTLAAALPVVVLLGLIASNKIKAHFAAILALVLQRQSGWDARQSGWDGGLTEGGRSPTEVSPPSRRVFPQDFHRG